MYVPNMQRVMTRSLQNETVQKQKEPEDPAPSVCG
jgi:hypothetical protein